MSAKPGTVATWVGTPMTPSVGKRTAGFVVAEKPPAQYLDFLFGLAGQWQQYLNDGAFSGASTFDNTLGVTGLLTASAGITVPTGQAVTLAGTTGLTVGTDGITNNGAATIASTLGVTGLITASNGVTAGTNKDLTLSGSGSVRHGTWTKILVPNANANGNTFITIDSSTIFGWCVMLDQHFQAGDTITAIRVNVTDNATGPTRASAKFRKYTDGNGTPADLAGPTATSGTAGTLQQISFTGLSESIAAGKTHLLQVLPSGGTAAITLWSIEIDWTR